MRNKMLNSLRSLEGQRNKAVRQQHKAVGQRTYCVG